MMDDTASSSVSMAGEGESANVLSQLQNTFMAIEGQTKELNELRLKLRASECQVNKVQQLAEAAKKREQTTIERNQELQEYISEQNNHLAKIQKGFEQEKQSVKLSTELINALKKNIVEKETELQQKQRHIEDFKLKEGNFLKQIKELNSRVSTECDRREKSEEDIKQTNKHAVLKMEEMERTLKASYNQSKKDLEAQVYNANRKLIALTEFTSKIEQEKDQSKSQFVKAASECEELRKEVHELKDELAASKKASKTDKHGWSKVEQSLKSELAALQNAYNQLETELKVRNKISKQLEEQLRVTENLSASKLNESNDAMSKLASEMEALKRSNFEDIKSINENHSKAVETLNKQFISLQRERDHVAKALSVKEAELNSTQIEMSNQRETLDKQIRKLNEELKAHKLTKQKLSKLELRFEKKINEVSKHHERSNNLTLKNEQLTLKSEEKIKQLESKNTVLSDQIRNEQKRHQDSKTQYQMEVKNLEAQLAPMKKQVHELSEYKLNASNLIRKEKELCHKRISDITKANEQLKEQCGSEINAVKLNNLKQVDSLQANIQAKLEMIQALHEKQEALKGELATSHQAVYNKTQDLDRLHRELDFAKQNHVELKTNHDELKQDNHQMKEQLLNLNNLQAKQTSEELHTLSIEKENIQKQNHMLQRKLDRLTAELKHQQEDHAKLIIETSERQRDLQKSNDKLRDTKREASNEIKKLQRKLDAAITSITQLKSDLDKACKDKLEELQRQEVVLQHVKNERDALKIELLQLQKSVEIDLRKSKETQSSSKNEYSSRLTEMQSQLDRLMNELEAVNSDKSEVEERFERLKRENEDLKVNEVKLINIYKNITSKSSEEQPESARSDYSNSEQVFQGVNDFLKHRRSKDMAANVNIVYSKDEDSRVEKGRSSKAVSIPKKVLGSSKSVNRLKSVNPATTNLYQKGNRRPASAARRRGERC